MPIRAKVRVAGRPDWSEGVLPAGKGQLFNSGMCCSCQCIAPAPIRVAICLCRRAGRFGSAGSAVES